MEVHLRWIGSRQTVHRQARPPGERTCSRLVRTSQRARTPHLGLGVSLRLHDERVHELSDPVARREVGADDGLLVPVL